MNQLLDSCGKTYADCAELLANKNIDYAIESNPYKNFEGSLFVGVSVERAILVRIMDKISRISNLLDKEAAVKDESIYDTLIDAINYLAILKARLEYKTNK